MAKTEADFLQILSVRPERASKLQAAVRLVIGQLSITYGLHNLHIRPASWGLCYLYTLTDILVNFLQELFAKFGSTKYFLSVPDIS